MVSCKELNVTLKPHVLQLILRVLITAGCRIVEHLGPPYRSMNHTATGLSGQLIRIS